jgi:hypothetical protein
MRVSVYTFTDHRHDMITRSALQIFALDEGVRDYKNKLLNPQDSLKSVINQPDEDDESTLSRTEEVH